MNPAPHMRHRKVAWAEVLEFLKEPRAVYEIARHFEVSQVTAYNWIKYPGVKCVGASDRFKLYQVKP